jgi:hypothetical protein
MPFIFLLIGAVLLVAAIRNTHGDLGTALTNDVPGFFRWALAILVIGGLGFVPGMRPISRWLLALVIVVIVLTNYQRALAGLTSLVRSPPAGGPAATSPSQAYVDSPTNPNITPQQIAGATGGATTISTPLGAFDPAAFIAAVEQGIGGFGGVA